MSEYQALPDLDANANAIAIEHIKLENEGFERDTSVTEPQEPTLSTVSDINASTVQCRLPESLGTRARLHPLDQGCSRCRRLSRRRRETLADWPLGRRNRALAELRCSCFGPALQGWIACPQCGEKLEFQMDGRAMPSAQEGSTERVTVNGRTYRLPTARDLARAAQEPDPQNSALKLLQICSLDGDAAAGWSAEDVEAAEQSLAQADPMAETRLAMECPKCGKQWDETLDLASFVWAEIEARAKRLLVEIHSLASAYGWTEPEILSLSEARRACYLELVQQ